MTIEPTRTLPLRSSTHTREEDIPANATRAIKDYLASLDDAAFGSSKGVSPDRRAIEMSRSARSHAMRDSASATGDQGGWGGSTF